MSAELARARPRPMVGQLAMVLLLIAGCGDSRDPGAQNGTGEQKLTRIQEMYDEYRDEFPEVRDVDAGTLRAALSSGDPPVLVDVRTPDERAVSIIPGAISQEAFESEREALSGRPVVTYCTIGYRSGLFAEELRRQGWDVRNLQGSILAWTHEGGELVDDEGPTRRVHVYGRRWNLVPEGFEPVW